MPVAEVHGWSDPAFVPVREVLARGLAAQGGGGLALAVHHHGAPVLDLTAGEQGEQELQLVFSVTKAMSTIAIGHAVDAGLIDLDRPLAREWPEFARRGADTITLRHVMTHRSGLPVFDTPIGLDALIDGSDEELLAAQEPRWTPGARHGYHAFTFGTLVRGAFLRTVGVRIREYFDAEIARPLGLDAWIGVPRTAADRVRPIRFGTAWSTASGSLGPTLEDGVAVGDPAAVFNNPDWVACEQPAATGVATARSLSRMMAATLGPLDGIRAVSAETMGDLLAPRSAGVDAALGFVTAFGSGFQLPFPQFPMLGPSSYGHEAAGGSAVVADADSGLAVGFTTDTFPALTGSSPLFAGLLAAIAVCARES